MCTFGPCKLLVHTFKCQNPTCARVISADGRECYIAFENITTGIAKLALRQICEGVALGSGTLTARLQEILKRHVKSRNAGLRYHSIEPRSVKTLLRICVLGMQLMTKAPPTQFFKCPTCRPRMIRNVNNEIELANMNALCIDGIWLGSQRSLSETFTNITTACKPIPPGLVRTGKARPRSALIRKHTIVTLLIYPF